jgi:hypothetical protein
MTKDEFADYLRALQAHDYAAIKSYYTDDYRAHFDGATFDCDGVIAVETALASIADSSWEVLDVVADGNAIVVHAFIVMRFKTDSPPGFPIGEFKAGQQIKTRFCGFYRLRGKQICEFRIFPFQKHALRN